MWNGAICSRRIRRCFMRNNWPSSGVCTRHRQTQSQRNIHTRYNDRLRTYGKRPLLLDLYHVTESLCFQSILHHGLNSAWFEHITLHLIKHLAMHTVQMSASSVRVDHNPAIQVHPFTKDSYVEYSLCTSNGISSVWVQTIFNSASNIRDSVHFANSLKDC